MKRLLLILMIGLGFFTLFPVAAGAADPFQDICTSVPNSEMCQDRAKQQSSGSNAIYGPDGIVTKVTRLLSIATGVASVIMVTVGGIQYVMSTGDPSKTAKAKNTILFAVVGIVVAIMAQSIVVFVLNKL